MRSVDLRLSLTLAVVTALTLALACERPVSTSGGGAFPLSRFSGDGPTAAELRLAADEMHVPVELLAAAAYSETRFVFRDAEGGESSGRGLFQLDDWAIGEAAVGLHETPERVASEPQTHARAFAWLLFRGAAEHGEVPAEDDVVAWLPHLSDVRANLAAGESLVSGVSDTLGRGFALEVEGEHLALEPDVFGRVELAARPDQPGVRYVQSVNYRNASRGRGDVDTVVIHMTQGSYGGTISWFQNPDAEVSSHYVVRSSDGEITQMVEEEDIAWHASCWNGRSIGIEHEGFVDDPAWFTEEMYRSSAALTRGICERWGIPMDRDHIKGHVELSDCNDHTDPGRHWDWDHYIALVRGDDPGPGPAPATGTLMGFVRVGDLHNEAQPIAGARVSLAGGPETRSAGDGLYRLDGLAPGHYVATIEAEGYQTATIERDVVAGDPTWGSVGLQPGVTQPTPPTPAADAGAESDAALAEADADADEPEPVGPVGPDEADAAPSPIGGRVTDAGVTLVEVDAALVSGPVRTREVSNYDGDDCRIGPGPAALLPALLLLPALRRRRRSLRDTRSGR